MAYGHSWGQITAAEQAEKAAAPLLAVVLLSSGHLLKVRGITLYPIEQLAEIARLRELAASKMGGVSTGVGFLGSPGWAIGGGIALGLLERAMSTTARKEGVAILRDGDQRVLELAKLGKTFTVNQIFNQHEPHPRFWFAELKIPRQVNYAALSRDQKSQFLLRYGKDKGDVVDPIQNVTDTHHYAHDGGEFVTIDTSSGPMKIRWQHVASYSVVPEEPAASEPS